MTGYFGAHTRIRTQRGKASSHLCVDCGGRAVEWSLEGAGTAVSEQGFAYSEDPADYRPRCRSCHRKHDLSSPIVVNGERNPMATVTDAQVAEARALRAAGMSAIAIAARYGVARTTVTRWVRGETRSSLNPS